jgi:hypothetical protein
LIRHKAASLDPEVEEALELDRRKAALRVKETLEKTMQMSETRDGGPSETRLGTTHMDGV